MKSALYRGRVAHDRLVPRRHAFRKSVNFVYKQDGFAPKLL